MKLNNPPLLINNQATYQVTNFDLNTYLDFIQLRTLPAYKVKAVKEGRKTVRFDVTFSATYLEDTSLDESTLPLLLTSGLFDYQEVITKVAHIKERYAIFADAGLGKCHGYDTPILMYDGSMKMVQDIQRGDRLMGPDSNPRLVLSTTQGYGPLHKIIPTKGDSFICNDVHVLSLRCTGTRALNPEKYTKDTILNIPLNEYLEKGPMFKSYYKLWRTGVDFQKSGEELKLEPYMLGIWLGDGTKNNGSITLNSNDLPLINYLKNWANDHGFNIRGDEGRGCATWHINNHGKHNSWYKEFLKSVIVNDEKRIPKAYLTASKQDRLELLAGLLDTDGYLSAKCFEITTKYKGLAEDILFLVRSLGLGTTYRKVKKGIKSLDFVGTYYKIGIYGNTDIVPTKVERKQAKPRQQKKNVLNTGFEVEYLGNGDYYGFTLEGDGLYLLGDFTVTHNTNVLAELARQAHASEPGKILFCIPLNILHQFEEMVTEFFPDFPPFVHLHKSKMSLDEWLVYDDVPRIGFVNHEAFIQPRNLKGVDCFLLDESSILKGGQGGEGKIAKHLIECTKNVKRIYAASATPAPNDRTEYAMIALLLRQVNSEKEFYSLFFTIKDDKYVLKRHATEAFYRYLSTFSIFIRNPKAYGFEDNLKDLKMWQEIYKQVEMTDEQYIAINKWSTQGKQQALDGFAQKPRGMTQRGKFSQISKGFYYTAKDDEAESKHTILVSSNKPATIAQVVQSHAPEQVIVWVVFDEEGEILLRELSKLNLRVVHISGKTKEEKRIEYINQFRHGELDVIISKPRILGYGLNFQFCHIAIYSGLQDSYEQYYQSVKRIHRYGQKEQVLIYHVYTPYEEVILQNVLKKQKESQLDFDYQEKLYVNSLYNELKQFLELEDYKPMETPTISIEPVTTSQYQLYHGDSIKMLTEIATTGKGNNWLKPNSIDLSVFSPPFMGDVFTYSNNPADMGNTRGAGATGGLDEFMLQFQFFLRGMLTVTKPGRIMAMHLEDVPLRKGLDGAIGLFDFVGHAIREAVEAGWILVAKIPIIKNQQMTAIVKKVSSLAMGNMETDRLRIAPCQNGTLALFRKPGDASLRVADLAKCLNCKWEGYAKGLNGWQPDRGYKSAYTLDPQTKTTIKDGETKEVDGVEYQQWLENEIAETEAKMKEKIGVPYSDLDTESIGILQDRLEKLQQKRLIWVTCPKCGSNNIVKYTEMNGNKWIIYAEGTWTDSPQMNGNYDKISKMTQEARWLDLVYTAMGVWPDINEPDTLPNPFQNNDAEDADKHLCPLPIEIARRAIELYTLPGETVYTPFLGIGTEVVQALKLGRKAIGCELKPEYFMQAVRNAEKIVAESQQTNFFDLANLEYITVRSK